LRHSAANRLELVAREHLAGRVVRRVDDDRLGLVVERRRELVGVERPVRLVQGDVARRRARQDRVGPVVLVERLEDHDLVARVDDRHHRRHHRFGRAAADGHLLVGHDRQSVAARELVRHGFAQRARAPGDGVLIHVAVDGGAGRRLDGVGRRKVRKPLRQVHATVQVIQPRHLADDRLGELGGLFRSGELRHSQLLFNTKDTKDTKE
jgi:hypothetical protein